MNAAFRLVTTCAAVLTVPGAAASAQDFPARPVRIVASQAGSSGDFVARVTADALTKALGQQVIVDNRGGCHGQHAG